MSRAAFVAAARAYIGTRWRHLGRDAHGMDCVGLVLAAARDVGLSLPEPGYYPRGRSADELIRGIEAVAAHAKSPPAPGDVLLFRAGRLGAHLGILAEHPVYRCDSVIHCPLDRGEVCEEPMTEEMRGVLVSRHVLPGLV